MNFKLNHLKRTSLFLIFFLIASFNAISQPYLPLTGGTLTGNLGLVGLNATGQIQAPYLGFSAFYSQPATSSNFAIFPNSSTGTIDIVGPGWRFIPANSSSYPSAVMTIDASGNVVASGNSYVGKNLGIGTTTSSYPLQIGGNIWNNLGSNYVVAAAGDVAIGNATTGSQPRLSIIEGTHGTFATIQKFNGYTSISDGQGVISLNGNIGIGTTSPTNRLDVQGGNADVYNTGAITSFLIGSSVSGKTYISVSTSADAGGYGIIQSISTSGSTYGNTVINPTAGNVLIGRTTQNNAIYMLDVNGPAHATSIVVNGLGADFVFEPTYHLFPLADLKKYLDQNHHLPEIPSAKEMQTNGLNVGDNQIKLLQKVEELTLYAIASDKQINDEKAVIAKQQEMLMQLQDLLKAQQNEIDQLKEKH